MALLGNEQYQILPENGFHFILKAEANMGNCRNR